MRSAFAGGRASVIAWVGFTLWSYADPGFAGTYCGQPLALAEHSARRWEPKRLRLFSIAGRLADHGRTRRLHLAASAPWSWLLQTGLDRLRALPAPI